MKRTVSLISLLFVAILLAGCGKGVSIQNIMTPVDKTNASNVYKAIKVAGSSLGWKITKVAEGNAIGELALRSHIAIVEIPYSAREYSIIYKDSRNLKYDASKQTIHRNYNVWVKRLDGLIQSNLVLLGTTAVSNTEPVETQKEQTKQTTTIPMDNSKKVDAPQNSDWR